MLSLIFQFQNPIFFTTCLHKPFLNHPLQTKIALLTTTWTHNNNNNLSSCIGFMMSQPKHCVLSIGSTGSPQLSEDTVPGVEFSLSEEEEQEEGEYFVDDYDEEEYVDNDDDDNGVVDKYVEERENFDISIVSKKDSPQWGEVEEDNDFEEYYEDNDSSFVSKNDLPPRGEVEEDDDDDEGREFNASFVPKKELPIRKEVDTFFVGNKALSPWGQVEDFQHRDSRTVETTLSSSKEIGLMNEHRALYLEEMDGNVLSNRILVLSRTNKVRSAMEYLRSMELSGLCPNIHACNSLISSLLRNGRLNDCFKVFDFTRSRKITNGHSYSLILMVYVKAHGYDAALNFFKELESECNVEKDFDAVVYNTMISICRKVDNWNEIERVWRVMKANGCSGTEVTYQLFVNSFARCGQSELALSAYHEMIQNGFEPDGNTLNAIISVYAKERKWDAASSVFQKMLKGGLKPNVIACNALINTLGKAGELKLAFQVYDTMKSLGHKPDIYTFNALLISLNKANRQHEALQLFEMIERNYASQINIHLYNTVLVSCSKLRLWDRAIEILWQMESSGLSDLTVSYNLVIRTCELARKPSIALQVYKHMVHQKCIPNMLTYLSITRCCVYGELWEELEEILKIMPNAILYDAAIQAMCSRGKVNLANKVYAKMLESGLQPDVKTQVLMLSMIRK